MTFGIIFVLSLASTDRVYLTQVIHIKASVSNHSQNESDKEIKRQNLFIKISDMLFGQFLKGKERRIPTKKR
jgi:hypothetical protein